jgi:hypothetical protein
MSGSVGRDTASRLAKTGAEESETMAGTYGGKL